LTNPKVVIGGSGESGYPTSFAHGDGSNAEQWQSDYVRLVRYSGLITVGCGVLEVTEKEDPSLKIDDITPYLLSSYLRNRQILIDKRIYGRQIILPLLSSQSILVQLNLWLSLYS